MADDAKQAWNDVGERFASLGNRLSDKYRESGSGGEPGAAETQRKLQETAKEVGDQLSHPRTQLERKVRGGGPDECLDVVECRLCHRGPKPND